MIRRFWLKNADGATYQLTNCNVFMNDPSGLGFSKTYSTLRLGDNDIVTSQMANLSQIQGDVLFMNASNYLQYQEYLNFIKFLSRRPIQLFYKTPNLDQAYFCDCLVVQLDKSEISRDGILHAPISVKMTSFWQTAQLNEQTVLPGTNGGKVYSLVRPYAYGGSIMNNIEIYNNGTIDAGLIIEINGEATNPQINFYDANDIQYGVAKLEGTFDYVEINSVDKDENITLESDGAVLANPASYQDLSIGSPSELLVTFVKLKPGKNTLSVSFSNTFAGNVKLSWRDTYVSV